MDQDKNLDNNLMETTLSSKTLYEGRVISLRVDKVALPDGREAEREIIDHPGGCGVIPVDKDRRVYLVKQYRHPYEYVCLEIPAGKMDKKGENPLETGIRELKEETGFTAGNMQYLGEIHPSVGYCAERLHIFLATDLCAGETDFDDDEFLNLVAYDLDELVEMVMNDRIHDAKTQIAILKAKKVLG